MSKPILKIRDSGASMNRTRFRPGDKFTSTKTRGIQINDFMLWARHLYHDAEFIKYWAEYPLGFNEEEIKALKEGHMKDRQAFMKALDDF